MLPWAVRSSFICPQALEKTNLGREQVDVWEVVHYLFPLSEGLEVNVLLELNPLQSERSGRFIFKFIPPPGS